MSDYVTRLEKPSPTAPDILLHFNAFAGAWLSTVALHGIHSQCTCWRPQHKAASGHSDVGECKQGDKLRCVLLQSPLEYYSVTVTVSSDSEWKIHFGPHAGVELFGLLGVGNPPLLQGTQK
jgi:hypothetical protein